MAGTGVWGTAKDKFRDLVAATAAWQSWTGLGEEASKARILAVELEEPDLTGAQKTALRPRMFYAVKLGANVAQSGIHNGSVRVIVEAAVDPAHAEDPAAAYEDFENNLGALLAELVSDAEADTTGDILNMVRFGGDIEGPMRNPVKEREANGDHIVAEFSVDYGPEGV